MGWVFLMVCQMGTAVCVPIWYGNHVHQFSSLTLCAQAAALLTPSPGFVLRCQPVAMEVGR